MGVVLAYERPEKKPRRYPWFMFGISLSPEAWKYWDYSHHTDDDGDELRILSVGPFCFIMELRTPR
jgi:hypothetical protein